MRKSWLLLFLVGAGLAFGAARAQTLPPVTSAEAMATAEAYRQHAWTPGAANAFHGKDREGVQVDTPDENFRPATGTRPGWWRTGAVNLGVPYMWGGFCSLEEFDAGVAAGKYAGDVYTARKRELLDGAVSRQAVGIDCSGFISRCWKLPRSYSTRELADLCEPLADPKQLRAGDILNLHNAHVLLFKEFTDETKTRLRAYETGAPPTWKVMLDEMGLPWLLGQGYKPYRYKRMAE